jgi:hypothetical protein
MKTLKLTLLALLLTFSTNSIAQTADEIVNNYIEAIGGKEKLSAITSIKMTGKISAQGMEIPVESVSSNKGEMYIEIDMGGIKAKQMIANGEKVWGMNGMTQKMEEVPSDQAEAIINEFKDFPNPFLGYKEKGYTIEFLETLTEEGTECHKVKLTKKPMVLDGETVPNVSYYYFDTETFVPIVVESEIPSGPSKGVMMKIPLSDYQEVDGIYFPFSTTMQGMPLTYSTMELNPTLEDSAFSV